MRVDQNSGSFQAAFTGDGQKAQIIPAGNFGRPDIPVSPLPDCHPKPTVGQPSHRIPRDVHSAGQG
jgi:hypothetical protein